MCFYARACPIVYDIHTYAQNPRVFTPRIFPDATSTAAADDDYARLARARQRATMAMTTTMTMSAFASRVSLAGASASRATTASNERRAMRCGPMRATSRARVSSSFAATTRARGDGGVDGVIRAFACARVRGQAMTRGAFAREAGGTDAAEGQW